MARTKTSARRVQDKYLQLIHRFPLRPIRSDAEHERATEIIGELIGRKIDSGSADYLDTLILLTSKYEDEHHNPTDPKITGPDAIRAIMEANNLSQVDIGHMIKASVSTVSMFLSGLRGLSKPHIKLLSERFGLNAAIFL